MNNIFRKPYISELYGQSSEAVFPYTREQLSDRPIFPTYIYDGGASFFQLDAFKTNDSDRILEFIMSGELFKYYEYKGVFDWSGVYKKFTAFHYTAEWEAHLWLNRLYLLLPVAQKYMQTGDRRYAQKWYSLVMDWYENNPYTDYSDRPDDMVWRDMQVAWRTINLVHSVFMLEKEDALDRDQWLKVYELIKVHADQMFREGLGMVDEKEGDNHHLQIGMALIMIGVLFPEFGNSEASKRVGRSIIKNNLDYSIYDDGVNNEDSISYAHFIARLYLEAELLLIGNGEEGVPSCAEKLQKQYEFLYQFSSPSGHTLQIGDSYVMDAEKDIEFVNEVYPLSFVRKKTSRIFKDSRMAVLRCGHYSIYIDAMDMTEWHQHYGRPNYVAFYDEQPIACDSGCVDYDRYDLRCVINSPQGHNVLVCPDIPLEDELEFTDNREQLSIEDVSEDLKRIVIRNRVTAADGRTYCWDRCFEISENGIIITDTVDASEKMNFQLLVHMPASIVGYYDHACTIGNTSFTKAVQAVSADSRTANQRYNEIMLSVECTSAFGTEFSPCVDCKNTLGYAKVLKRSFNAEHFSEQTKFAVSNIFN